MDAKDNRKRADDQIKILAVYKSDMADSDSDASTRVPHKKKEITGVIPAWKQKDMKTPKHKGYQCYYVIYTTTGITDRKYKSHRSKDLFGRRYDQEYIKEGPGWRLGNRRNAVKHY